MADITLDDIMKAPTDTDQLAQHLLANGYIQPPAAPPAAAPMVAPAEVQPMQPVTPKSDVASMTPPNITKGPHSSDFVAEELRHSGSPTIPLTKGEDITAPEMGGTPAAAPDLGIKPMTPPTLTHAEKMALPQSSTGLPDIGSAAFTRNQLERIQEQKENPWGTAENHPGILGKIGHIAGKVGNIALDALAPGIGVNIPGTDLNRMADESSLKRELAGRTAAEGEQQTRGLQNKEAEERIKESEMKLTKEGAEQSLEKDTEGNIVGWKGPNGQLHSLEEEGTPQAIKDIAEETQNKPHFEKSTNGDIVQITPGKKGEAATSNVVYKAQPGQKLETKQIVGLDGHSHDLIVDMNAKDDQGRPGKVVNDLGRSKEDRQESPTAAIAKDKANERVVMAYDKDGKAHYMSKADADEEGMTHVTAASTGDIDKAKTHHTVLNTLQTQLNSVVAASDALNQNIGQRAIILKALSHPENTFIDNGIRAVAQMSATEKTNEYIRAVLALREAGLGLPKEITGGSRVSEIQAGALWQTMPGAASLDSKYAIKQAGKFQQDIDRLRERAPLVRGLTVVDPDDAIKRKGTERQHSVNDPTGKGEAPKPPEGKVVVYDQDKIPHFVNSGAVDKFLKDPKYKNWTR